MLPALRPLSQAKETVGELFAVNFHAEVSQVSR